MRFRDAAHVDLGSFYARRPGLGRIYRVAGYGACLAVLWWADDPGHIGALLVCLLIAWVMAWKREVGALFRGPLVAAILMGAVVLTADRLEVPLHPAAAEAPPPAPAGSSGEPRRIEFRFHGDGSMEPLPPPVEEGTR